MVENIPGIGNANINQVPTNTNKISNIGIGGPQIIPAIDPPTVRSLPVPVIRGLELPVVNLPNPSLQYPIVRVPTQSEFDAAVKNEQKSKEEPQEKTRGLPDAKPQSPQVAQIFQTPLVPPVQQPTPVAEVPANTPTFTVGGIDINLPDPSLVATAGAVAVVTTAATMASTTVLNVVKNAAEPLIREATKNKFKIKIKQVKPVLHYVMTEGGHVDIFEYSSEGTRLVAQTDNVEQYIRDQVETNAYYEMDNKIIIDDVMKDKFTKEGQERFKSLYTPPKKIAKKLSARLSF